MNGVNDYTQLCYGSIIVETSYDLFVHDYEKQIGRLVKEIKHDILGKVANGQDLNSAICATDKGFGSPAVELLQYVATDDHHAYALRKKLSREEYEGLEGGYNGKVSIRSMVRSEDLDDSIISGFTIDYSFHYEGIYYSGFCKVDIPRFRWIYRRQKLVNAMKKLIGNAA